MKKQGFMLAEAVITTAVVMISFVFLYANFVSSYNQSLKYSSYNNMEKLYLVHSFASFIMEQTSIYANWANDLNTEKYINVIEYCNISVNMNTSQKSTCQNILKQIGVEINNNKANVIFVKYNPTDIRSANQSSFTSSMREFISKLSNVNNTGNNDYRLIIQFKDGYFGSLRINH